MAGEKVVDGKIVKDDETEVDETEVDETEVDETEVDKTDVDETDVDVDDDNDDDDDNVETWMTDDDDDDSQLSDVPVSTHIRMKRKLKGRLSEKDEELERLREENTALKSGVAVQVPLKDLPKRPREQDFETIAEFETALAEHDDKMLNARLDATEQRRELKRRQSAAKANIEQAVDDHYDRAANLIKDNKIDIKVYKTADRRVREVVEAVKPGLGDTVTDSIISILGEGSEKVMYFLGRNPKALGQFKNLLENDPSGLKASVFLGKQQERLLNSRRKTSKARPPADDVKGDKVTPQKGKALLKKRKAALKADNVQLAYDLKKQAKAQGVDVSNW